jgi:hypothetical protein
MGDGTGVRERLSIPIPTSKLEFDLQPPDGVRGMVKTALSAIGYMPIFRPYRRPIA